MSKTTKGDLTASRRKKTGGRVVRLAVMPWDWDRAEQLARVRTLDGLEPLLADLVSDLATAAERPDSWEAAKIWAWLDARYRPAHYLLLEKERREAAHE